MNTNDIITTFKNIETTKNQLTRLSQHESIIKFFKLLGNRQFNNYMWDDLMTRCEVDTNELDVKLDPDTLNKLVNGNKLFENVDLEAINTQKKFSQHLFNAVIKDIGFIVNEMNTNDVTNFATTLSLLLHAVGLGIREEQDEMMQQHLVDFLIQSAEKFIANYENSKKNESKKRKNDSSDDDSDSDTESSKYPNTGKTDED